MTKPIIDIQNVSKKYKVGQLLGGYKTIRESLFSKKKINDESKEFWALKDVSFKIYSGDSIGIIGKNGAGKSTLLKILSRITLPTEGKIICRGRIASLLEVGTGFHGELTGRENIFLNGSILGMPRLEIQKKFDEIVDFSGVENFIDTPIKHYSSGMQLRLAFAVAAHLEPEVMIIDEVLAVGDYEFQKKCLNKMQQISRQEGATLIFVSHNLIALTDICNKAHLLVDGKVVMSDTTEKVTSFYIKQNANYNSENKISENAILKNAFVESVQQLNNGINAGYLIDIVIEIDNPHEEIGIDIIIKHSETRFCYLGSPYFSNIVIHSGKSKIKCSIGPVNFLLGQYSVDIFLTKPMIKYIEEYPNILEFEIEKMISHKRFNLQLTSKHGVGYFVPQHKWSIID